MCDTIGKIINEKYAIFGKNSDRAVNEPQVVEYYESKDYVDIGTVKCTYISIPQVKHTNAIVLSRPIWLWGGEIGVNEFGLCIGNEAVFTKGKYGKDSLIGMDLLRLALERSKTPLEAIDCIIKLLDKYGQGGNCGYDSNFHYNNSFLIMNQNEIYVLETKDKDYVYKKYDHVAISNCLSIEEDGDVYKQAKHNFRKTYSDFIMTFGSKGKNRRALSLSCELNNKEDMFKLLSKHSDNAMPFLKGSVGSVCMHASNSLTADQTTMSMVVELIDGDIKIWVTGCSLPCVSFFKPAEFKVQGIVFENKKDNDSYWYQREEFNRLLLNKIIPDEFFNEKNKLQKIICQSPIEEALKLEKEFYQKWMNYKFEEIHTSLIYNNFWNKKNRVFIEELDKQNKLSI